MEVRAAPKKNVILGKVVGDATGHAVPDVVVVALDFDRLRMNREGHGPEESPEAGRLREVARREGGVAAALVAMESAPDEDASHFQRLGSVITDDDGSFLLSYDDDLFEDEVEPRVGRPDRRPDIILLVLAPDRPSKTGGGHLVSERLLYYSRLVQFESGRLESFVIRIPEDRLVEFGVLLGQRPDETEDPAKFQADNARRARLRSAKLSASADLVKDFELPRLLLEKKTMDTFLPKLVQRRLGSGKSFVGFAPNKSLIISKVWEGFQSISWLLLGTRRTGRVYLTPEEVAKLGTTVAAANTVAGANITFFDLLSLLGYAAGPYRNRHLLSQIEIRRSIAKLNAPAAGGGPAPGGAPAAATEASLRVDILNRLREQVLGLAREPAMADPANDLSRLRRIVDQLEQTSGIGNAAAMHDVDVLQVAFEPVWTSAFDATLTTKAKQLYRALAKEDGSSILNGYLPSWDDLEDVAQLRGFIGDVVHAVDGARTDALAGVGDLALELSAKLSEPYSFEYFAPGSINYGIMQTYRQSWTPISYQVGRVVDSIPLTPSETQTTKLSLTAKRRRKTNSRELSSLRRTDESSSISRTEVEAMEKTALAMTHQTQVQASFNVGIGSLGSTSTFGLNQSQESQRIHKSFAEISRKASQEVRRETEVQYEVEVTDESLSETTRTLRNANDEMTVTYVLYELERRYSIASRLQAVQPVLLVALQVPPPHAIDDAWLLEHAWVIRDVLLDNRFEEAFDILENSRSRDDAQIAIFKANYDAAYAVRRKADLEFERLSQLAQTRRADLIGLSVGEKIADANQASSGERVAAAIFTGGLSELFGGGQSNQDDLLRARREGVEKQLEYLEKEISAAAETRDKSAAILNDAADKFSTALTAKAMADQKLLQLRLHVRGNLYHYLHEIWKRRDPDDLFFSLYDLEVPFIDPLPNQCFLRAPTAEELEDEVPGVVIDGTLYMVDIASAYQVPNLANLPKKRLIEVADVDRPLGFKGNYVIFPLKVSSLLTDFMTVGFLDGYYGVRDPALNSSYSAADLVEYARSVWNDPVANLSAQERDKLAAITVRAGHRNPGYESEVVLPTGKVWMEALKGGQALLEPFKLAHRGLDVLKVEEEVRRERLDNLRRAQRIGLEEPLLGDPDIEKVTLVRGLEPGLVLDPDI
jgi:hypothetical protein